MRKPILTHSSLNLRSVLSTAFAFLVSISLYSFPNINYSCVCDSGPGLGYLKATIVVNGTSSGETFTTSGAFNIYTAPDGNTLISDGTQLVEDLANPFTYVLEGYVLDGTMPMITLLQLDGMEVADSKTVHMVSCQQGEISVAGTTQVCASNTNVEMYDVSVNIGTLSDLAWFIRNPSNIITPLATGVSSISHTWSVPAGTYQVQVTGTNDNNGCEFTEFINVMVSDYPAEILGECSSCSGNAVGNLYTYYNPFDNANDDVTWCFTMPGGGPVPTTYPGTGSGYIADPFSIIPPAGTYTLTAKGTSEDGCIFDVSKEIIIYDVVDTLEFSISDTYVCEGSNGVFVFELGNTTLTPGLFYNDWVITRPDLTTDVVNTIPDHVLEYLFDDVGIYTVTISGTLPDGCDFETSVAVEVPSDPGTTSLACNNSINITTNLDCEFELLSTVVLEGVGPFNNDAYTITLTDADGNVLSGNTLSSDYIGQTLTVMITAECGGNSCWGNITLEDKSIPPLSPYCQNLGFIAAACDDFNGDTSTLGFPNFPSDIDTSRTGVNIWYLTNYDNCGDAELTFSDEVNGNKCDPVTSITRTWTVTDFSGFPATSSCTVDIEILNNTGTIVWPFNYDDVFGDPDHPTLDACHGSDAFQWQENADGTPTVESIGGPILPLCGDFTLLLNSDLQPYQDDIIYPCGTGSAAKKVLRLWRIYDACNDRILEETQIINIMDSGIPICAGPAESQIFADIHECQVTFTIPPPEIFDCSDYTITYQYKVKDEFGFRPQDFTTLPAGETTVYDLETTSDTVWINYIVEDACGNVNDGILNTTANGCFTELEIIDVTQPTAVCDLYNVVTLNDDGCSFAGPSTFDDYSNDNCGIYERVIQRMDGGCDCASRAPYFDYANYLGEHNGHYYYLSKTPVNGYQAIQFSESIGAYAAVVNNAAENTFIRTAANFYTTDPYFIGMYTESLNSTIPQSSYLWADGSSNSYSNFNGNFQSSFTPTDGQGGNYVVVDADGTWRNDKQTNLNTFYVFEIENSCGWSQKVKFCCEDLSGPVTVAMRVIDNYGNHNECTVQVEIKDITAPQIVAPANVTIDCTDDVSNLTIFGMPTTPNSDIECSVTVTEGTPNETAVSDCGSGSITRFFTATDAAGNTATASQLITLTNQNIFVESHINWPNDNDYTSSNLASCDLSTLTPELLSSPYNVPTWTNDACTQVTYSYHDQIFDYVDDACQKLLRTWTVIDWCQPGEDWTHVQIFKLNDDIAPVITNCDLLTVSGDATFGCTLDVGVIEMIATDACTSADRLTWHYELFLDGQSSSQSGNGNVITGAMPVGNHRVVWHVVDHCGNESSCTQNINIVDTMAPTAYCLEFVVTSLDVETMTSEIWAKDLILNTQDNCGNEVVVSFDANGNNQNIILDCNDIENGIVDTMYVDIYFSDGQNQAFCNSAIIIQDNQNVCPDIIDTTVVNPIVGSRLAGRVYTEDNRMLDNVNVTLTSNLEDITAQELTELGEYSFEDIYMNNDYFINIEKDDYDLNGVSTLDIVLIQKHILGITLLDSPYKVIAADANNSNSISAVDLIELRKLILGIYAELPDNDSWRFVEEDFVFANDLAPWPFSEAINHFNLPQEVMDNDFVAIKIGDVNYSSDANLFDTNDVEVRSGKSFDMNVDHEGEQIVFRAGADTELLGTQFSMRFNKMDFDIQALESGSIDVSNSNINTDLTANGIFNFSWNSASITNVKEGEILFAINIANKSGKQLITPFYINEGDLSSEAYAQLTNTDIEIQNINILETVITQAGLEVFQNVPNPFSDHTKIGFTIDNQQDVSLQIMDYTGRMIYAENRMFDVGYNDFIVDKNLIKTSGILYYQISTDDQIVTKRMIALK